jgi:hypothetical protein
MGAWKDMLIDMDNAMLEQQALDDWNRYEMERDEAIERRREIMQRAWDLYRFGRKAAGLFPQVAQVNFEIATQYREEARQIRRDWR